MLRQNKFSLWLFLLMVLASGFCLYQSLKLTRAELVKETEARLLVSISGIKLALADDFHDRALNQTSISEKEDQHNIEKLSQYVQQTRLEYAFTIIPKNGDFHYTAVGVPSYLYTKDDLIRYFQKPINLPTALLKTALLQDKTVYHTYNDQYGTFISIYRPDVSLTGQRFIAGAEFNLMHINQHIKKLRVFSTMIMVISIILIVLLLKTHNQFYLKPYEFEALKNQNDNVSSENYQAVETKLFKREQEIKDLVKYKQIMMVLPDLITLIDPNYIYQLISNSYLQLDHRFNCILGCSMSRIIGEELFTKQEKNKIDRCLNGETLKYTNWFVQGQQGRRLREVTYLPVQEKDGTIAGVVMHSRDITHLKTEDRSGDPEQLHELLNARTAELKDETQQRRQLEAELKKDRKNLEQAINDHTIAMDSLNSNLQEELKIKDELIQELNDQLRTSLAAVRQVSDSLDTEIKTKIKNMN